MERELASRKSWRATQQLVDEVWRGWLREYLPWLITRDKWTQPVKPLKAHDTALIVDDCFKSNTLFSESAWTVGKKRQHCFTETRNENTIAV